MTSVVACPCSEWETADVGVRDSSVAVAGQSRSYDDAPLRVAILVSLTMVSNVACLGRGRNENAYQGGGE